MSVLKKPLISFVVSNILKVLCIEEKLPCVHREDMLRDKKVLSNFVYLVNK